MADYDPYASREVEVPLTVWDAFFSLVKCVIGTGILAMPLAFKFTGVLGGCVLTVLSMFVLIYGMELLIMCMVESCRRKKVPYMTFHETMEFAFEEGPKCCRWFSKAAGYSVDIILGLSHYGVNVVYIVFVAVNLKQFIEEYFAKIDLRILIAIVGICCIPLFLLRHLKYLVPSNILATCLILLGILAIFWYLFRGLPSISERNMFPDLIKIPFALGIVLFSISSVGVMLAIESKMAEPKKYLGWLGVLSVAAILICILYIFFGLIGYWRYGDATEATITLNIPVEEILAQVIKLGIAVAIFLTYPLSGYVTVNIIMDHLKKRDLKNPHMVEYIVRICFVLLTTLNGIAFPNLGPLLSLVGAFSISVLNLIFPCFIELCLYHDSYGKFLWKLWKNILIIIFGSIIFFYGSYTAFVEMIEEYFT
ncbi:glutamate transporter polyphemus isoform X1 [Drosophila sulfurigaster albostrigata]|uniref:glutamate transporter polyphemus isoform X1 n=1 Tax=Drosophila sulfurigaster albostrigata TaxID=89887 RepID=UPI002D21A392|nr:glutamate transporter polyphemus isoform X1 [Drosophila sulfurigaster albostrigata]